MVRRGNKNSTHDASSTWKDTLTSQGGRLVDIQKEGGIILDDLDEINNTDVC